jgi:hypothetical protein
MATWGEGFFASKEGRDWLDDLFATICFEIWQTFVGSDDPNRWIAAAAFLDEITEQQPAISDHVNSIMKTDEKPVNLFDLAIDMLDQATSFNVENKLSKLRTSLERKRESFINIERSER